MVGGDVVDGVSGYLARVEDDAEPESSKRAPLGLLRGRLVGPRLGFLS